MEDLRTKKCNNASGCSNTNTSYDKCPANFNTTPWEVKEKAEITGDNIGICCTEKDPDDISSKIKDKLSGGAIAGIVIGCIAGAVLIVIGIACSIKRTKEKRA